MDEELKRIVQRMIDAGESEENTSLVIREYDKKKKSKKRSHNNYCISFRTRKHQYYIGYRSSRAGSAFGFFKYNI